MENQIFEAYIEKGFFGAVGFIFTSFVGLFMYSIKQHKEFRRNVYDKIDNNAKSVVKNHPTKDEFELAFKSLEKQIENMGNAIDKRIDVLHDDIRELRDKL